MSAKRVLLTGATSFTGAHIARAFHDAGYEVAATLTGRLADYSDPVVQRRREHSRVREWVENAPFGSTRLLEFLQANAIDVFVNHGASIKGYRQPDFDYLASVKIATENLRQVVEATAKAGCKRWIHSGSIFEADEGEAGLVPAPAAEAMSIYGIAKSMVWQPLRFYVVGAGLSLSKIVIPNPVGTFENVDRLIPVFAQMWKAGKVPSVRTPQLVRDNLPAPWLAKVYAAEAASAPQTLPRVRRPSAYALSNEAFLQLVARNFGKEWGRELSFESVPQTVSEPLRRVNVEAVPEMAQAEVRDAFWKDWALSLK